MQERSEVKKDPFSTSCPSVKLSPAPLSFLRFFYPSNPIKSHEISNQRGFGVPCPLKSSLIYGCTRNKICFFLWPGQKQFCPFCWQILTPPLTLSPIPHSQPTPHPHPYNLAHTSHLPNRLTCSPHSTVKPHSLTLVVNLTRPAPTEQWTRSTHQCDPFIAQFLLIGYNFNCNNQHRDNV